MRRTQLLNLKRFKLVINNRKFKDNLSRYPDPEPHKKQLLRAPDYKVVCRVADPDPDSIGSVDPDPDSESGSGSRRAKMTHK